MKSKQLYTIPPTPPAYELVLHRLPDLHSVGGNRRYSHPMQYHRAIKGEQRAWMGAMLLAGIRPAQMGDPPLLYGPVGYTVTFHTPYLRLPDEDNQQTALKPLLDLLEIRRFVKANITRGYLGVINNDNQLHRLCPIFWVGDDYEITHLRFWELLDGKE